MKENDKGVLEVIKSEKLKKEYYDALVRKDSNYDGIFFAALKPQAYFAMRRVLHVNLNLKIVRSI